MLRQHRLRLRRCWQSLHAHNELERCRLEIAAELVARTQPHGIGVRQRGGLSAMPSQKLDQQPMRRLSGRIEQDQPLGGLDRRGTSAGLRQPAGRTFEHRRRQRPYSGSLVPQPVIERLRIDDEAVEQLPMTERARPLEVGQLIGSGEGFNVDGIDG